MTTLAKRRVLLVDDEVTVLLTMKAVLEISGFDVDTAASAREGKARIKTREYQMVITDMRMESDASGREVIEAARQAPYHPAIALLTAYPIDEADAAEINADKVLVKATQTAALLKQLETLLDKHAAKLARLAGAAAAPVVSAAEKKAAVKKKSAAKRLASKVLPAKKKIVKKPVGKTKPAAKKKRG